MATIEDNLQGVRRRIEAACTEAGRAPESVGLIAVSKRFGPEAVREAQAAGARRFGENYVQEGIEKIQALADLRPHVEWHLIGPLQSNKTRLVAEQFDWVHAVDRLKIAQRLSEQRPADLAPLQLCLEVNIDQQPSKSGFAPDELAEVAAAVAGLPRLRLRGLMAIPDPDRHASDPAAPHRALARLLQGLQAQGLALDTLSMGMSADLEAAIAAGATLVRVGTAIFGARSEAPAGRAASTHQG